MPDRDINRLLDKMESAIEDSGDRVMSVKEMEAIIDKKFEGRGKKKELKTYRQVKEVAKPVIIVDISDAAAKKLGTLISNLIPEKEIVEVDKSTKKKEPSMIEKIVMKLLGFAKDIFIGIIKLIGKVVGWLTKTIVGLLTKVARWILKKVAISMGMKAAQGALAGASAAGGGRARAFKLLGLGLGSAAAVWGAVQVMDGIRTLEKKGTEFSSASEEIFDNPESMITETVTPDGGTSVGANVSVPDSGGVEVTSKGGLVPSTPGDKEKDEAEETDEEDEDDQGAVAPTAEPETEEELKAALFPDASPEELAAPQVSAPAPPEPDLDPFSPLDEQDKTEVASQILQATDNKDVADLINVVSGQETSGTDTPILPDISIGDIGGVTPGGPDQPGAEISRETELSSDSDPREVALVAEGLTPDALKESMAVLEKGPKKKPEKKGAAKDSSGRGASGGEPPMPPGMTMATEDQIDETDPAVQVSTLMNDVLPKAVTESLKRGGGIKVSPASEETGGGKEKKGSTAGMSEGMASKILADTKANVNLQKPDPPGMNINDMGAAMIDGNNEITQRVHALSASLINKKVNYVTVNNESRVGKSADINSIIGDRKAARSSV